MVDPVTGMVIDAVTKQAIAKTTGGLVSKLGFKFAKDKFDGFTLVLNKGLPTYLEANYAKCETLKTLLNRNDPVSLKDCFVAPDFKLKGETIDSDAFLDTVNKTSAKVIITGLAGSGKSVFLKHTFRTVIEKGHTYYPIFFELRNLNRSKAKKGLLLSEIYASIKACCESFTRAQFNYGLKTGAFYFLLDGFDELKQELREQVSDEITALARDHYKCAVVVTSRPSDEFVSWEGFSESALLPFDLEKVKRYISKLTYDKDKKNDFLSDLEDGLFEKHKDFLSNPLLSAMMLLTYDSFGEIPEKRHVFYDKCYDVLSREHDASKGRYKRELFSSLAADQIEKAFMYFCALSYDERVISFSEKQIAEFVAQAIEACGVEAETPDVIRDFRESISIIEKVGLSYEFAHRSFQEYFYAKFVVTDRTIDLERKIDRLIDDFRSDDTIEMIADMDRTYFEDGFLLPRLSKLDDKLKGINTKANPAGILSKFFRSVDASNLPSGEANEIERKLTFEISTRRNWYLSRQAIWNYRDQLDLEKKRLETKINHKKVAPIIDEEFGGRIKIHHTNNAKLIRVEAHLFAEQIKYSISRLRQHLEQRQQKRKKGLGAMLRRKSP